MLWLPLKRHLQRAEAAQQLLRPALVPGPYEVYYLALAHAAPPLTL